MKVAYSYARWSSGKQKFGDSQRRQIESTQEYCTENNLYLNESFIDDGVSAFRGKNKIKGALGRFLKQIENGKVEKGSVLIVESLDRISRDEIIDAQSLFLSILCSEIEIHTLIDNQIYTRQTYKLENMITSIVIMSRANEESKTKSIRVSASRQTRRNNLGNGDIMTAKCPGWLRVVNRNIVGSSATGGTFEIIPERKEVVKRIFELAKNGMGKNGIAKLLNSEKVPVFGNSKIGWQHLYIFQTLHNPAVIGEYQPHKNYIVDNEGSKVKKRIPIGDVVKNYYPPIISEETFYLIKSRTVKNVSASKGDSLNNLFSGFAYCKKCGAPLHYVSKNKNTGEIYLVCSRARAGAGCEYKSIRYQYVENEVLHLIHELKSSDILSDGSEEKALREKHISLDEQSKTIDSRIDNFIDAIADEADKRIVIGLKGKITVLENEKEAIKDKLKSLKQVPSSTPNKLPEFHSLIELLKSDKSVILRHKIRASLMDMVTRIEIDTEEKEIEIHFPGNISRGIRPDHESGGLDVVWYGGEHSVNRL